MAYNNTNWKDNVRSPQNTYTMKTNEDGTVTLTPAGMLIQQGTNMSAQNFNNMENGIFACSELGAELTRVMLQQKRALGMIKGESGTVTLKNTLAYPFNNSVKTVSLAEKRDTADYTVEIDAGADGASVGRFIITDKLLNGFKIAFTGGASSVTVNYTVWGGVL